MPYWSSATTVHFECLMTPDGTVTFQYLDITPGFLIHAPVSIGLSDAAGAGLQVTSRHGRPHRAGVGTFSRSGLLAAFVLLRVSTVSSSSSSFSSFSSSFPPSFPPSLSPTSSPSPRGRLTASATPPQINFGEDLRLAGTAFVLSPACHEAVDCAGEPNGGRALDVCGVCGGVGPCLSLTSHCRPLTFRCLSLTFHCLSLIFHCFPFDLPLPFLDLPLPFLGLSTAFP